MSNASRPRKGSAQNCTARENNRTRLTLGVVIAALAVCLAFLATELIRYSRNVPGQHSEWVNSKLLAANIPMGTMESMVTRNALNRNRLCLHAWHGYNEFLMTKVFSFGDIQFDACIAPDSYLVVIFNKDADSFSALRLSRNPAYPSAYIRADNAGRFLEKTVISDCHLTDSSHAVQLSLRNDKLRLEIDGVEHGRWNASSRKRQVVGFRSGARAASVDNVIIIDAAGNEILRDNFRNQIHLASLMGTILAGLATLICGIFAFARWSNKSIKRTAFAVIMLEFVAVIVLSIFFAFDYFHWSEKYSFSAFVPLTARADWSQKRTRMEKIRTSIFDRFQAFDKLDGKEYYQSRDITRLLNFLSIRKGPPYQHGAVQFKRSHLPITEVDVTSDNILDVTSMLPKSSFRIMVIGTSQTWGEGASTRNDQFVFQIHDQLLPRFQGDVELVTINASIRGSHSTERINRYTERLYQLEPDVVVVNLSNNDSYRSRDEFEASLTTLVTFNSRRNIQTLFVLEANSSETSPERLAVLNEFHQVMETVSKTHQIPCVDLDNFLANDENHDSGFLWWDYVHFTPHGQRLAASFVVQSIADHVLPP